MKRLNKRSTICLIAENDGVICGVIDGYIIESIYYKEKVSYLDHLYVIDKYRRKKVGQSLIEEFTKIAQQKNGTEVKDNAVLYLVLELFGLGIVTYALVQSDLNTIADKNTTGQAA